MEFSSGSGVRTLVLTPLRLLRFANCAKLKIEARDLGSNRSTANSIPRALRRQSFNTTKFKRQKKRVLDAPLKIVHGIAVNNGIADC